MAVRFIPWDNVKSRIGNCLSYAKSITKIASVIASVSKTVAKAKTKIKREKGRYDYWIAKYVDFGNGVYTYIPTTSLSFLRAMSYVRAGGNVFADSKNNAYKLANAIGGGRPIRDAAHGGIGYWRHYHATGKNGKRIDGYGHIFYV